MLAARSDYFAALLARADSLARPPPGQQRQASAEHVPDAAACSRLQPSSPPEEQQPCSMSHAGADGRQKEVTPQEERRQGSHAACSTSGQEDAAGGRRRHGRGAPDQDGGSAQQLPVVDVLGVSAPVLEAVLRFVYTDGAGDLGPQFLHAEGAETLFDAADRYLLFTMKVGAPD